MDRCIYIAQIGGDSNLRLHLRLWMSYIYASRRYQHAALRRSIMQVYWLLHYVRKMSVWWHDLGMRVAWRIPHGTQQVGKRWLNRMLTVFEVVQHTCCWPVDFPYSTSLSFEHASLNYVTHSVCTLCAIIAQLDTFGEQGQQLASCHGHPWIKCAILAICFSVGKRITLLEMLRMFFIFIPALKRI